MTVGYNIIYKENRKTKEEEHQPMKNKQNLNEEQIQAVVTNFINTKRDEIVGVAEPLFHELEETHELHIKVESTVNSMNVINKGEVIQVVVFETFDDRIEQAYCGARYTTLQEGDSIFEFTMRFNEDLLIENDFPDMMEMVNKSSNEFFVMFFEYTAPEYGFGGMCDGKWLEQNSDFTEVFREQFGFDSQGYGDTLSVYGFDDRTLIRKLQIVEDSHAGFVTLPLNIWTKDALIFYLKNSSFTTVKNNFDANCIRD